MSVCGRTAVEERNDRLPAICDQTESVMFEMLWVFLTYPLSWLRAKHELVANGSPSSTSTGRQFGSAQERAGNDGAGVVAAAADDGSVALAD